MSALICTHHVFEASQHRCSNDAQKEGDDVEDGSGPQQVIEVHHVLAALHVRILVVAPDHLHAAGPVGGKERETAYGQATKVMLIMFILLVLLVHSKRKAQMRDGDTKDKDERLDPTGTCREEMAKVKAHSYSELHHRNGFSHHLLTRLDD